MPAIAATRSPATRGSRRAGEVDRDAAVVALERNGGTSAWSARCPRQIRSGAGEILVQWSVAAFGSRLRQTRRQCGCTGSG
jgi:hypothetical protein